MNIIKKILIIKKLYFFQKKVDQKTPITSVLGPCHFFKKKVDQKIPLTCILGSFYKRSKSRHVRGGFGPFYKRAKGRFWALLQKGKGEVLGPFTKGQMGVF